MPMRNDMPLSLSPQTTYHLGNMREVVNEDEYISQVMNYYPFGAPYADAIASKGADVQPYKYNGKELDLMHGLNTYDYGARQHDPILARWDRIDPLCEKYYSTSPYAYCENDPVNTVDSDGRSGWEVLLKVAYKIGKSAVKNGGKSLTNAATYADAFSDVVEDTKTLFDSNSSTGDRVFAGLSLLSEIVSPISIRDGKTLGKTANKLSHRIKANDGIAKPHGGKEYNNVEFDNSPKQSAKHKEKIEQNDPNSINDFFLLFKKQQI